MKTEMTTESNCSNDNELFEKEKEKEKEKQSKMKANNGTRCIVSEMIRMDQVFQDVKETMNFLSVESDDTGTNMGAKCSISQFCETFCEMNYGTIVFGQIIILQIMFRLYLYSRKWKRSNHNSFSRARY